MARGHTITVGDLDSYREDISSVTREAVSSFRERARAAIRSHGDPAGWGSDEVAAVRDEVAELMDEIVSTYGDATQSIASEMFEGVLDAQGEPTDIPIADMPVSDRARASSRQWIRKILSDDPDEDAYIDGCSGFVERHVSHSADGCVIEAASGGRRRKRLRFARVPSGPSCGFCIMLASRGFVYASRETAGEFSRFHNDCDCRVVAGYDGLKVAGYDPDGLRARYRACRDAIGSPKDVWRDFQDLPQDVRDSYGRGARVRVKGLSDEDLRRLGAQADAFNDYYARRIAREMDSRDRRWLYDGTVPRPSFEPGARPLAKERETERLLGQHGFRSTFRNPRDRSGRTSDVFFVSGSDEKPVRTEWEFKCPEGASTKAVKNQMKKASGTGGRPSQCDRVVISNVESDLSFDEMCSQLEGLDGEFPKVREVIIVSRDGRIRHYVRGKPAE